MQAFFKGRAYGAVTIGKRGQLVIPSAARKALNIKSGDQVMVFAKPDKKVITLMPSEDFSKFLERAEKLISKLESKLPKK
jgi:AbrB family looped-hinge helix DNA binding protein